MKSQVVSPHSGGVQIGGSGSLRDSHEKISAFNLQKQVSPSGRSLPPVPSKETSKVRFNLLTCRW